jgi:hypothetical protein
MTATIIRIPTAGANPALSNLASVAINLPLLPDAAAADDFGSGSLPFKEIFISGSSGSPGTNNFKLTGASTSGTRAITLPDATDTLVGKATTDTLTNKTFVAPALGTPASGVMTNVTGLPTAGLVDAAVTLAKMANLGQDLFIGRVTASTGVPETTTITAAARTVLDDTTVAAMVNTIGGATATGSGGLARATSPVFVTPTLGTPASGVMTNVTGIPITALANGTDGELITWNASGVAAAVAVGDDGEVLTSNGAGAAPTMQAAGGGGTPRFVLSTPFESLDSHGTGAHKYQQSNTGSGGQALAANGLKFNTGTTDGSRSKLILGGTAYTLAIWAENPEIHFVAIMSNETSTGFVSYVCFDTNGTVPDAAGAMTVRHFGFILDTTVLDASNANSSSQTTTDISSGITITNLNVFRAIQTGTTNVKFYVNNVLVATHTTNLQGSASPNHIWDAGIVNDSGTTTDRFMEVLQLNAMWDSE